MILAIVGFAAVAALWAGCGGGSDETGSTADSTATLTKAQFVKKADEICAERKKEWNAEVAPERKELQAADGSVNEAKVEELIQGSLVPLMKEELQKLEALGAPAGDEKTVNTMMENRSKAIADIEADSAAISSSESLTAFATEAQEYGVKCPL
ncbi:MAG TPA: hypothetical protein VFN18_07520 [Solirubrobacterales bacterium]|nr:hypothetical protein [Solirubrobacterales bacterium]